MMRRLTSQVRIAQRKETTARGYVLRAKRRMKDGDLVRAIEDYSRAIELDPRLFEIYFERFELRLERKEFGEAVEDWTRAIEWNPYVAEFFNCRARTRARLEDLPGALEDMAKAVELEPREGTYRKNLHILQSELAWQFFLYRGVAKQSREDLALAQALLEKRAA